MLLVQQKRMWLKVVEFVLNTLFFSLVVCARTSVAVISVVMKVALLCALQMLSCLILGTSTNNLCFLKSLKSKTAIRPSNGRLSPCLNLFGQMRASQTRLLGRVSACE